MESNSSPHTEARAIFVFMKRTGADAQAMRELIRVPQREAAILHAHYLDACILFRERVEREFEKLLAKSK